MTARDPADRLIRALHSPAAYPHPVDRVESIETHISWVLLVGEFAYKIKKPVQLGFLDFSTLDRREHFCREELRLNVRLAPSVYLDVVPITGTPDAPRVGGEGEPIEFAVRMRRFPQEALLSRLLERGGLTAAHIDRLAVEIAEFHRRIAVAGEDSPFGTPEAVWLPVAENFRHLNPPIATEADRPRIDALQAWSRREFHARAADFVRRKAEGFIRECHGDMHLGNMLLLDGSIAIFDGIEFNESFRWIDVLSEIAFAVMDLADRSRADFAHRLLNAYLEQTGDYGGLAVLRYYLTYRALVRAKVACIRGEQKDVRDEERQTLREEFRGYLDLAERSTQPRQPILLIAHGPSGSGKSSSTQPLVEALGAVRLRSDVERKRLFGLAPLDRGAAEIYSPAATARTYDRLAALASAVLHAGYPAIVDATFLRRTHRDSFRRLADSAGVPFAILDFRASNETLRQRVARRAAHGGDPSEADLAVLEQQLASREPLTDEERRFVVEVENEFPSSSKALVTTLERLRRA